MPNFLTSQGLFHFTQKFSFPLARGLSFLGGIYCLLWGLGVPPIRGEGLPAESLFSLSFSMGAALLAWAIAFTGKWKAFVSWLALGIIGQALALQAVEAGPFLRYQHYQAFNRLSAEAPHIILFVFAQALFVAMGLRKVWRTIGIWIGRNFTYWQIMTVCLIFLLPGAAVSRSIKFYAGELALAALIQVINLGNIVLAAWHFPEEAMPALHRKLEEFLGTRGEGSRTRFKGVDGFALLAAGWVTVAASILAYFSYEGHPHITDEVAYLIHARFLAQGAMTLPAPPVPEAFDLYLIENLGGRWFPVTLPGWPAVLAIGVSLGIPVLVNPLLAGLNILLAYLLLLELYDRRTARTAVLLFCVSPWYIFMGMNFMAHTLSLTCFLAGALGVARARRTGRARWAWIAGGALGAGCLIRPLDGVIAGGLIFLWALGAGSSRLKISALIGVAGGALFLGSFIFPYNQALTGSPTTFALNDYLDRHFGQGRNDLGFGANRGYNWPLQPFPGHSPLSALINADLNTFSINAELFGWTIGSLLLVSVFLVSRRWLRSDSLMFTVCLAVFWPYFFYYYSGGPDFGARYWYLMILPLVVLTARGLQVLHDKFDSGPKGAPLVGSRLMVGVLSLILMSVLNYFPWRAVDKYHHFWGMRPDIRSLAQENSFGKSLVLIRGRESHPDFASAAVYNPLDWNADAPVYAWDCNPAVRAQLLKVYSHRPIWIVDSPSMTGKGYQIVKGPIPSNEMQSREGH